jgi:N-acyl-D-amino-acid deacylase
LPYATASGGKVVAPLDLLDTGGSWFTYPSFAAYRETLESKPAAINAACLLGHTTLRVATMDHFDRAATRPRLQECGEMYARGARERRDRAFRPGTAYTPRGRGATEEIIEVCGRCPNSTRSTSRTCATRTTQSSMRLRRL